MPATHGQTGERASNGRRTQSHTAGHTGWFAEATALRLPKRSSFPETEWHTVRVACAPAPYNTATLALVTMGLGRAIREVCASDIHEKVRSVVTLA